MRVGIYVSLEHGLGDDLGQRLQDLYELVRNARDAGFELLLAGQYVGRMGLMSLSLPLEERAYDGFLDALSAFVTSYRGLWRSPRSGALKTR